MKFKNILIRAFAMAATLFALPGCNLMHDDMEPCATDPDVGVTVNFVYDYNMQDVDLFDKEAGSVYLYVFDSRGVFLQRRSAHRSDMGAVPDFSMHFTSGELTPGTTYRFLAIAESDPEGYNHTYIDSKTTPGFTLRNELIPGVSTVEDYVLVLDRDNDGVNDWGVVDYRDAYGNTETMIQTLWSTKPDETQILTVPIPPKAFDTTEQLPDVEVEVTVPVMRITNTIRVNLTNSRFSLETDTDDYNILIDFPNGNGTIDFTGTTMPAQELFYRAIWKKIVPYSRVSRDDGGTYAIQATFGVSRLQATDGSSLQIRDPQTNEIIDRIDDFSAFLAEYFNHGFDDPQEFLDREYDFEVDIELTDEGKIKWVSVGVAVLGWTKRIWRDEL